MNTTKYAVFTMDIESFADTDCIKSSGIDVDTDLLDGFDEYIKILDKYGIKSTLFTVGKLAPKISDRLKTCIDNGHRLALHNYKHVAPMHLEPEKFREKIKTAKQNLSEMFNTEIEGFRAPCFSIDKERLDILKELGFKYDSSYLDFSAARHTVKLDLSDFKEIRKGIFCKDGFFEFGLSKQKIFGNPFPISGGGYVRIGNWNFIKSLITQYIKHNNYYVFYLHPFELTHQKVPFLKGLKAIDRYYINHGISTYGQKIEYIIKLLKNCGYEFVTFEQLKDIMQKDSITNTEQELNYETNRA